MIRFSIASIFLLVVSLACYFSPVVSTPTATSVPTQQKILVKATPVEITATVTASQSLHVRTARGLQAIVIGYLYYGDQVELTGQCDRGWAEIVWHDGTAWVNAKFLSENKCSEEK